MLIWRRNLTRVDLFGSLLLQKRTGPSNGLFLADLMLFSIFILFVDSIELGFEACAIGII